MTSTEKKMVAIDGTDALAYVILRPGSNASGVVIEAAANGISKPYAAYALRHTAQSWDPDDTVGADVGEQLKAALAEVEQLRARLDAVRTAARTIKVERDHLRTNAQKLAASWRRSSEEHGRIAESPELLDNEGMANRQGGRSVQLVDCAFDLEGVLAGENPDGWTHGIAVTATATEPASS